MPRLGWNWGKEEFHESAGQLASGPRPGLGRKPLIGALCDRPSVRQATGLEGVRHDSR